MTSIYKRSALQALGVSRAPAWEDGLLLRLLGVDFRLQLVDEVLDLLVVTVDHLIEFAGRRVCLAKLLLDVVVNGVDDFLRLPPRPKHVDDDRGEAVQ